MSEQPYSNREIDLHFQDIKESLARIEAQTMKTNGRVNALEGWRMYMVGGLAVITFIGAPLLAYNLLQTVELSKTVYAITQK